MNDARPLITVEFYGVPRLRAGRERVTIRAATVGELVAGLIDECPALAPSLARLGKGASDCLLSLNGKEFVNRPGRCLQAGDVALILSADPGG